jgi:enoyl-CoA hydratase/carnithine racemase
MSEWIKSEVHDGVVHIQIDRPQRKNALTRAMYTHMAELLESAAEDAQVRVALISGHLQCFSAGNDMVDFVQMHGTASDVPLMDQPVFRFLKAMQGFQKSIVAAVCGPAVGIGTTMLLHCDHVVAGDNAMFSTPFVSLGLCSEAAASALLPKVVGVRVAQAMLLWGRALSASEALQHGLITELVAVDDVLQTAQARVAHIAALPASAVLAIKSLMKTDAAQISSVMSQEADLFQKLLKGDAAKEAFTAFIEKRKPNFFGL